MGGLGVSTDATLIAYKQSHESNSISWLPQDPHCKYKNVYHMHQIWQEKT